MPTLGEYMTTFQNPQYFLTDPELAKCICPKDQQGQPLVRSGGFALTFRLESATAKWAVRCFHQDAPNRAQRYDLIAKTLHQSVFANSGYFVEFDYQSQGVVVQGHKYPIVKMSWAKGETLGSFIEKNYNNKNNLLNLQAALQKLRYFLEKNGIAHGDIQPGNVMVSNGGQNLQLIDYDGMFVPGMESLNAAEAGVPNFQHPKRQTTSPWNNRLDRFPFIVLDIALSVLSDNPQYWVKTNSSDEKIIFEATDYIAPLGSAILKELKADVRYSQKIAALQQICLSDFDAIPPADIYIGFKATQTAAANAAKAQTVSIWYTSAFKVFNGVNIGAIQSQEGKKIEIVGKVFDVYINKTVKGDPYCFINFFDYRGRRTNFRIVLWKEVLEQFASMGIKNVKQRFIGQYIAITGLVIKYSNNWGDTYQIVPDKANEISIINAGEMQFRLGNVSKIVNQSIGGTLVAQPSKNTTNNIAVKHAVPPSSIKSHNAQILQKITGKNMVAKPHHAPLMPPKPHPLPVPSTPKNPLANSGNGGNFQSVGACTSSPVSPSCSSNAERLAKMKAQSTWHGPHPSPQKPPIESTGSGCLVPLIAFIASIIVLGVTFAASLF